MNYPSIWQKENKVCCREDSHPLTNSDWVWEQQHAMTAEKGKRLSERAFAFWPRGCWERSNLPHTSRDKRHGWSGWIHAFASTCPQTKWHQDSADDDGLEREGMRCEKLHLLPPGLWRTSRSPWRCAAFLWSWSVCRGQRTGSRAVEGSGIQWARTSETDLWICLWLIQIENIADSWYRYGHQYTVCFKMLGLVRFLLSFSIWMQECIELLKGDSKDI